MILAHITTSGNIQQIRENGLMASSKSTHTSLLADFQNRFKPVDMPHFIDMNKCIYFFSLVDAMKVLPISRMVKIWNGVPINGDLHVVKVSIKDLDTSKLYVCEPDYDLGMDIYQYRDKFLTSLGVKPEIRSFGLAYFSYYKTDTEKEVNEMLATEKYNNFLISIKDQYQEKMKDVLPEQEAACPAKYEILYFGDIPYEKIISIDNNVNAMEAVNNIFDRRKAYSCQMRI